MNDEETLTEKTFLVDFSCPDQRTGP
jgi:hypothetical protein